MELYGMVKSMRIADGALKQLKEQGFEEVE